MDAELSSHEVSASQIIKHLEEADDPRAVENIIARLQETIRLLPELAGDFHVRLSTLRGSLKAMLQSR